MAEPLGEVVDPLSSGVDVGALVCAAGVRGLDL